jgi:hypothetical protein
LTVRLVHFYAGRGSDPAQGGAYTKIVAEPPELHVASEVRLVGHNFGHSGCIGIRTFKSCRYFWLVVALHTCNTNMDALEDSIDIRLACYRLHHITSVVVGFIWRQPHPTK